MGDNILGTKKTKPNRKLIFTLVISATLLILFLVITVIRMQKGKSYEYASPHRGPIIEAIYGLGKVKTHKEYQVKVGIIKTVKKIYVNEGDLVKKNDLLIQFEATPAFRSPIEGTVTAINVNENETVPGNVVVMEVQDLEDKYIEVSLEQQAALRVKKEQAADILFESLRGEKFSGKVTSLFPKNEEFIAHISVSQLGPNVLPGMTADVSITVDRHENVFLIPTASLNNGQVILRRDGKKLKVPVKIGSTDGQWAEMLEGDVQSSDLLLIKRQN